MIKRIGVFEGYRLFVNMIIPLCLGLIARAAVIANSPIKRIRAYLDGLARGLYRRFRSLI